jgi:hypothetical protein
LRIKIPPLIASLVCITGLGVLALIAGTEFYDDLVLASPAKIQAPRINLQKIKQLCEDEFPLTYELLQPERAATAITEYAVTLVGVNSFYPRILGFPLVEGSFFTQQAWDGKLRHVVLNEEGATVLFGSTRVSGQRLKIKGEIWIVSGVINDGDTENCRIYVPSSLLSSPGALYLLVKADETIIKDSLKSLGLSDDTFYFFNLGNHARLFGEQAALALMFFCSLLLILRLPRDWEKCRTLFFTFRGELKKNYLREVLRTAKIFTALLPVLRLAVCAAVVLLLLRRSLAFCLPWQDLTPLKYVERNIFCGKILRLQYWETTSWFLFFGALAFSVIAGILSLVPARNPPGPRPCP